MTDPMPAHDPRGVNDLRIEHMRLDELRASTNYARVHNRKQRRKLSALLQHYGVVRPVLVSPDGELIDGHLVVDVLKELGHRDVPAIKVWNRSPEEIRALRLALNRLPQDAGWDDAKLRVEFSQLIELGFDMELTGFETVEIDMSLEVDMTSGDSLECADGEDLDPAATTVVKRGDTWLCPPHTITCGDVTSVGLCDLLRGQKASVVFTDPPYNVRIAGHVSGLGSAQHREFAMASGEMDRAGFTDFLTRALAAMVAVLADGAVLFCCIDWRHARELADAAEANKLEQKNLVVWVKTNAGMGSFYRSQHELIFILKSGPGSHQNNFELGQHGRSRTNVWRYAGTNTFRRDRRELLTIHPTVKPTAMIADALRDVSRRGEIVLDPFLGSGSTLLAAEETGRVCCGVEIDPAYVEVAIRRWQKRTKRDAVHAATGETFDALHARAATRAAERRDGVVAAPGEAAPGPGAHEAGDE